MLPIFSCQTMIVALMQQGWGGEEMSHMGWNSSSVLGSFRTAALKASHLGNFALKQPNVEFRLCLGCFVLFFKTFFYLVNPTHSKPPDFSMNATK